MGDTPSGAVARRTCPSGVASFGRVTHAPRGPQSPGLASGSPKVGSRMVQGRAGRSGRRCGSSWTRLLTCPCSWWCRTLWRFHSCSSWGAVQFFDKVAGRPCHCSPFLALGDDRGVSVPQITEVFVLGFFLFFGELIVVCQCHRSWRTSSR